MFCVHVHVLSLFFPIKVYFKLIKMVKTLTRYYLFVITQLKSHNRYLPLFCLSADYRHTFFFFLQNARENSKERKRFIIKRNLR